MHASEAITAMPEISLSFTRRRFALGTRTHIGFVARRFTNSLTPDWPQPGRKFDDLYSKPNGAGSLRRIVLVVAFCLPARRAGARPRSLHAAAADTIHAVFAEHGMVVAQEKIAARIGADVLRQGGNAVDAAVATGFAMAVTYPRAGNIGGGGFMVIHSAGARRGRRDRLSRNRAGATRPRNFSWRRRQARQHEVARFRARHRRARHGRRAGAGAGEIRLGHSSRWPSS